MLQSIPDVNDLDVAPGAFGDLIMQRVQRRSTRLVTLFGSVS